MFNSNEKQNEGAFCSPSITEHLIRGVLGIAALVGAFVFLPQIWPTVILLPIAFLLMRGCPTCWTVGLFETIANKFRRNKTKLS